MPADVTLNSGSGGAIIATDPTTSSEHYQLIKLAQGAVGTFTLVTTANALPVVTGSSFQGGITSLSSQITVTATGPVTVTSGTVTLSSVHTILSASSGVVQAIFPVMSSAGFGQVTSSAGVLANLSSGTVTLSSVHTVTATAGTNPWSSAPGFNVPVVNVSSGLVQALGAVAASSGVPAGLAFVNNITTGAAALSVNVKGTPGLWFGYTVYNSTAALRSIKVYNTTSAPAVGSTSNIVSYLPVPGSTGGGGSNFIFPYGVFCSNGIGYTVTANAAATDTGAPGTNDVSLTLYYV